MTKKLSNGEKLIRAIRREVKKNPDFIYTAPKLSNSCLYFTYDDDKHKYVPSCVVGRGLDFIGFDSPAAIGDIFPYTHDPNSESVSRVSLKFLNDTGKLTNNEALIVRSWLYEIQGYQDRKETWVDSIKKANQGVPEILELFPYRESEKIYK